MPILNNPRYEIFAQEIAKGHSCDKAYITAGYRPSRANAHTLRNKKDVLERINELLARRESMYAESTVKAVEEAALTKAWVISHLRENALKALGKIPVRVSKSEGSPAIEEFDWHPTAANRALELLGRELNMFIERHEVGDPGEFARMTDDELNSTLGKFARAAGLPESVVARLTTDRSTDTVQ